jgi:hypothetical protein
LIFDEMSKNGCKYCSLGLKYDWFFNWILSNFYLISQLQQIPFLKLPLVEMIQIRLTSSGYFIKD